MVEGGWEDGVRELRNSGWPWVGTVLLGDEIWPKTMERSWSWSWDRRKPVGSVDKTQEMLSGWARECRADRAGCWYVGNSRVGLSAWEMVTGGREHEGGGVMTFGLGHGGDDEICSACLDYPKGCNMGRGSDEIDMGAHQEATDWRLKHQSGICRAVGDRWLAARTSSGSKGRRWGKTGGDSRRRESYPNCVSSGSVMLSKSRNTGHRFLGQAVETGVFDRRWTTKYRTDATIAWSAESLRCLYYKRDFECGFKGKGRKREAALVTRLMQLRIEIRCK